MTRGIAGLAAAVALPRPEGWIGTTAEWVVALGILLGVLDLVLLVLAWGWGRRDPGSDAVKGVLLVGLLLLPLMITFLAYQHGFAASETVASCGGCHVMQPFVDDLRNPASQSLAAVHYKNRFIQQDQCYTCHSDYGMFGTLRAKMDGLGHVAHWVSGTYRLPITIARPYPNLHCLRCHGESQKFLGAASHAGDTLGQLMRGTLSCLDCHGPAHTAGSGR